MRKTFSIEGLIGHFQTARQRMSEAQRLKPRNQLRLTGQDAFLGVTPRPRPPADLDAGEWRSRRGCAGNAQRGDFSLPISPTITQRAAQAQWLIKPVVEACGEDVQENLLKVLIGQAIEVGAVHRRRLTKQIGNTVVGHIILGLHQVAQCQLRWCPKAKSNGGRKTKTLRVGLVAVYEILTVR